MLKFALALCIALSPVIAAAENPLLSLQETGPYRFPRFKAPFSTHFLLLTKDGIKEITLVPQSDLKALNLGYEGTKLASAGKALEPLMAGKEICYYVTENSYGCKIDFYILDKSNGDTLYIKNEKTDTAADAIARLSDYLADARSILASGAKTTSAAGTGAKPQAVKKQYNTLYPPDRINIELGLYDFLNRARGQSLIKAHSSFLAVNYNIFSVHKDFVFVAGPFYSEGQGSNDIGLRLGGYYNRYPNQFFNIYTGIYASGGYCNRDANMFADTGVKLGGELSILAVSLFGEGGVEFRTNEPINLMVNMGVRLYIH